jgi:glucose-6-phosphate isomerase, archaeal
MNFGLDISPTNNPLGFHYGKNCFGPQVENRKLNDIRLSLLEPDCNGPETVYAIAMDVGKPEHKSILEEKMLLFGVVTYAAGRLGKEPVRSQGHIHKVSTHSGWSPPEVYEIWNGSAVIYMQEYADDEPGRCFAVFAKKGDVVIVPPEWAHATISADPLTPLTFGAWCDREYGFLYDKVKAHKGLAWYPLLDEVNKLHWQHNTHYRSSGLTVKDPGDYYALFGIEKNIPIYTQFENDPERFQFVAHPALKKDAWKNFIP